MTIDELTGAGFTVDPAAYERLAHFVAHLEEENQNLNLTAIRDTRAVWELHVCDSLSLMPLAGENIPARLLDLGTGGGIPGIPLACVWPECEVTLLDATRKKLLAAERIVEKIGLSNVQTLWGRAEDLAHVPGHREQFDVVAVRAVGPLPTVVEYAAGFVRRGGQCWFEKSVSSADRETEDARRAAGLCGLQFSGIHKYVLPAEHGERAVVIYDKRSLLRHDLPRQQGLPKRKPL